MKKNQKTYPIPLLLICVLLSAGCRFAELPGELDVTMPALPDCWAGLEGKVSFRLEYPVSGGGTGEICPLRPGETVSIPHYTGDILPAAAYPLLVSSGAAGMGFRPAGGIYPVSAGAPGGLELCWEEGFAAECLLTVFRNTGGIDWINLEKLLGALGDISPEDPWLIDRRRLIRPLIYGRFYSGFIRLQDTYPVPLPARLAGWNWGNPLLGSRTEGEETAELYEGQHRLIRPDGLAWADIQVDEKGWGVLYAPEGLSEEGFW